MSLIIDLFLTFAKIGLFTFGGGYAMISLIERTCAETKGWITREELLRSARKHGRSLYGQHLRKVARGEIRY